MSKAKHTGGPWEYVPSNEHHGPYICGPFGNTIADFYTMTQPSMLSTANGGPSKPVNFLHEMADPNARLAAQSPALLEVLRESDAWLEAALGLVEGGGPPNWDGIREHRKAIGIVIAAATGEP